jgi:hypothetical protein
MAAAREDEMARESHGLVASSRVLVQQSRAQVKASRVAMASSQRRLDRARNLLQAVTLKRELSRRRQGRAAAW